MESFLLQLLLFVFVQLAFGSVEDEAVNVYGQPLQPCSSSGMALSGYTRTGYCVNEQDDAGSHHICIDLSSTSTTGGNFCKVTGQPDWCSSRMPCHDQHDHDHDNDNDHANGHENVNDNVADRSRSGGLCQVQNWCVCQWAFASYVKNAGGCDHIQSIQCDAVNKYALLAYRENNKSEMALYNEALQCIERKCGFM